MRVVLVMSMITGLAACGRQETSPSRVPDGNAGEGKRLVAVYNCGSCHTIPGVPGAVGNVGPPLTKFGIRVYIAGNLPNRPDNLIRWLHDPPAIKPGTAMPDLGLNEEETRNIAAYLYTLR